jgi:hypothetical protein
MKAERIEQLRILVKECADESRHSDIDELCNAALASDGRSTNRWARAKVTAFVEWVLNILRPAKG